MKNSNVQLADLKESNMNQLVASEMFMIRGGGGKKKGSNKSSKKGGRKSDKRGCKKSCGWYYGCGW